MNELMMFEENEVKMIVNENGSVLFELYSTGMALGYVRANSVGKMYPRKDRIDKTVENAEITICVHDGHKYLTEEQLYDFMLEAKTEKCKSFRKWVTHEVLPTLRKTGSYNLSNNLPIEVNQLLDCINRQQEQINELLDSTKEQQNQIDEIKSLVGIRAKQTFNYSLLIKNHLGIEVANEDYRIIKEMFFIDRGISKWEDLSFDVEHVVRLKEICNQYIKPNQISFFDEDNK